MNKSNCFLAFVAAFRAFGGEGRRRRLFRFFGKMNFTSGFNFRTGWAALQRFFAGNSISTPPPPPPPPY